jgi:carbonic anhydrase
MIDRLIQNNLAWAINRQKGDPDYFRRLVAQQAPEFLWIGCADSRVPANEIVGLDPGELFVHRNIANLAIPTDINFLSVLAFAVNALKVRHIIVCGHYGCGGIRATLNLEKHGIVDHWLEPVREVQRKYAERLAAIGHADDRVNALCEYNVIRQVGNVACTVTVREAWARGQELSVHGWIYGLSDGLVRDLDVSVSGPDDAPPL